MLLWSWRLHPDGEREKHTQTTCTHTHTHTRTYPHTRTGKAILSYDNMMKKRHMVPSQRKMELGLFQIVREGLPGVVISKDMKE